MAYLTHTFSVVQTMLHSFFMVLLSFTGVCMLVCVCAHAPSQAHEWAHMLTCSRWGSPYLLLLTPGGPLKMSGILALRMPVPFSSIHREFALGEEYKSSELQCFQQQNHQRHLVPEEFSFNCLGRVMGKGVWACRLGFQQGDVDTC